ncbi:MAG: GTPase ObgE [Elusimicrobiota bacterium]|jgi:GTP-binding protein|nr:GTPase ObgE [Elusimicrobiota bacterium]
MFIDKATILITAGRGGGGCISFRREKYVPFGGPNGGNGGKGGDIYFEGDPHKTTLLDLSHIIELKAEDGQKGSSNNKYGKFGADLTVKVPLGSLIFKDGQLFADIKEKGQRVLAAKGGRGGRGNSAFKTKYKTAPRIAENGEPGEKAKIDLELRLIADIGFVGFPNAGKSTLLSKISAARPKIADFPFTTLIPNLGVVNFKGRQFTAADIPGIIEGAHLGKGLGLEFLRHITRTKILIILIDVCGFDGKDPYKTYQIINSELKKYSKYLAKKHFIIVLNKIDLPSSQKYIDKFKKKLARKKIIPISAVSGQNLESLLNEILKLLDKPSEVNPEENFEIQPVRKYIYEPDFKIKRRDGVYIVSGKKTETLTEMTKFGEADSLRRYQNILKKIGLEAELEKQGIKTGDTVRISDFEFVYQKNY